MRIALATAVAAALVMTGPALASDPVTSECLFTATPNAGIPGFNAETLRAGSAAECMTYCSGREWCRSVDYKRSDGACYIQPVGMHDAELRYDYPGNPYDHYTCEQRVGP